MRYLTLLSRGLRLRCPVCGRGKLFNGWWKTNSHCSECASPFAREEGFYLGAIYINYGLTALVATALYLGLAFGAGQDRLAVWASISWAIGFPILFFSHARSLWLAFDELWDPRPKPQGPPRQTERAPGDISGRQS